MYSKPKKHIIKDTQETLALIEERGHMYIDGSYSNRQAPLIVYCAIHENEHATTFYNYNRSRTGCPCCGKAQVSAKLRGRTFSEQTIERMSVSASKRPYRGGKPRRLLRSWRETHTYRQWRNKVLKAYQYQCAITGSKKKEAGDLVVHHLYSATVRNELAYNVNNGIVLTRQIHTMFHLEHSYYNNTLEQFISFLEQIRQNPTLISSQGGPEGPQGSETRAYDPERVIKLQERLEGIRLMLES